MNAKRSTALIVEDDPRLQNAMSAQLRQMDLDVLVANHYDAAVCHLAVGEPHVICIDVGLPNKSGYELCEHIRGRPELRALPILVTSERGFPEDMAYAEVAGANAFLKKPFSMNKLLTYVSALLDRAPVTPFELKRPAQNAYRALCGVALSAYTQHP